MVVPYVPDVPRYYIVVPYVPELSDVVSRILCAIPRRAVRNGVISRFTVCGYVVTHRLYRGTDTACNVCTSVLHRGTVCS